MWPFAQWLYKLHGLGVEYECEICSNAKCKGFLPSAVQLGTSQLTSFPCTVQTNRCWQKEL